MRRFLPLVLWLAACGGAPPPDTEPVPVAMSAGASTTDGEATDRADDGTGPIAVIQLDEAAGRDTPPAAAAPAVAARAGAPVAAADQPITASAAAPGGRRAGAVPETPSRTTIVEAMQARSADVDACFDRAASVAVRVVLVGDSGRVRDAEVVSPADATPAERACVRRAMEALQVPPFSRETYRVQYPFRVAPGG